MTPDANPVKLQLNELTNAARIIKEGIAFHKDKSGSLGVAYEYACYLSDELLKLQARSEQIESGTQ